ncbi:intracellular sulfur oxidation DsrE/DsrF family protein [Rhodovulum iodosum]|uniref:Intracellular sulfur oxidation DsrE/DsrF family protein n=1 Tax=Rhodovulum iodosum TaxID=68291 RepID=A0ABV3XPC7_9RHOB|nr:DsrE family protein [Rhodovulum robiginosum]RSK31542.1 hypothetical protein EJA01_15540 [Rhodovulum robiginosum]
MKSLALAALVGIAAASAGWAETHRIAVHVNQNDPQVMNMALNNVANLTKYYHEQGDEVIVEVVAYGPGLLMLVPGKSPVADRISTMGLEIEGLTFSACGNTLRKMSAKQGQDVVLMDEAGVVPSGVVRLVELQEQGFAYVRP